MKVISFVPSLTETLITAGVTVVGRTRFCIHPTDEVQNITVVGGTKNLDLEKVKALNPDLIVFDKEENNKEMFEECVQSGLKCYATHITNLKACGEELMKLGELLKSEMLTLWGEQYLAFKDAQNKKMNFKLNHLNKAFISLNFNADEANKPEPSSNLQQHMQSLFSERWAQKNPNRIHYVIWKKPFMVVNQNTFISDVLKLFDVHVGNSEKKYAEISEDELKASFCLFSSEPYPFHKDYFNLLACGYEGVLIDGEKISWYGIRNLKFLLDK